MAARRLTKKDIKEDTFVTTTLKIWEFVRENQNRLFIGLIVLFFIIAGLGWMSHSKKQAAASAAAQFAEALSSFRVGDLKTSEEIFEMIAERYRNQMEGAYAEYFVGKCALEEGRNLQAIEAFDDYLARSKRYPFFHDAAMDGKAVALENDRRYEEAAEVYLKLVNNLKTNDFMERVYLRRSAANFKLCNRKAEAIEIMERLLDKAVGVERRDIEVELELLRI